MAYGRFLTYEEVAIKFNIRLVELSFLQEREILIKEDIFNFVKENLELRRNYINEYIICESIIFPILSIVSKHNNLPLWPDPAHQLAVLRKIIPWQEITDGLIPFYSDSAGRNAVPPRTFSAILIIKKLRGPGDREAVSRVKENRYIQYFCNVPDDKLPTFIDHSTLSRIRGRIGEEGAAVIGSAVLSGNRSTELRNSMMNS